MKPNIYCASSTSHKTARDHGRTTTRKLVESENYGLLNWSCLRKTTCLLSKVLETAPLNWLTPHILANIPVSRFQAVPSPQQKTSAKVTKIFRWPEKIGDHDTDEVVLDCFSHTTVEFAAQSTSNSLHEWMLKFPDITSLT